MTLHDKLDALRIDRLELMIEEQQAKIRRIHELIGDGNSAIAGQHGAR